MTSFMPPPPSSFLRRSWSPEPLTIAYSSEEGSEGGLHISVPEAPSGATLLVVADNAAAYVIGCVPANQYLRLPAPGPKGALLEVYVGTQQPGSGATTPVLLSGSAPGED